MLPTFGITMGSLPENSFYRCGNVLVAVTKEKAHIHLSIFSQDSAWSVQENADSGFRHHDHGIYYGKITDENNEGNVKLQIAN